ncbi:MAG TPA: hypothetical protein VK771_06800 [Acidimicrobiia bacterium]|jgi:hypothetical protein|nr:hypothetical protein [Acidimicrobiia bacterium]
MSDAHSRAMRKWRQARSRHADVLTGLERAIAAHPAGGRRVVRRVETTNVTRVPRDDRGPDAA